jgi:hypothetical protein
MESDLFARGLLHTRLDLLAREPRPDARAHYRLLVLDLGPRTPPPRALATLFGRDATLRIRDLHRLKAFSHASVVAPLSSSALSTADELGHGLPFASWFSPDDARQAARWQLTGRLARLLHDQESRGLTALPAVRLVRERLDHAWRESRWRKGDDGDLLALRDLVLPLATDGDPLRRAELAAVFDELLPAPAKAPRTAPLHEGDAEAPRGLL